MWPKDTYGAPTNSILFRQNAIIILKEKHPDLSENEINSYFDIIMEKPGTSKADFVQEVLSYERRQRYPDSISIEVDLTKTLHERVSDYINFRKLNYDNI